MFAHEQTMNKIYILHKYFRQQHVIKYGNKDNKINDHADIYEYAVKIITVPSNSINTMTKIE